MSTDRRMRLWAVVVTGMLFVAGLIVDRSGQENFVRDCIRAGGELEGEWCLDSDRVVLFGR